MHAMIATSAEAVVIMILIFLVIPERDIEHTMIHESIITNIILKLCLVIIMDIGIRRKNIGDTVMLKDGSMMNTDDRMMNTDHRTTSTDDMTINVIIIVDTTMIARMDHRFHLVTFRIGIRDNEHILDGNFHRIGCIL
ncbi:hypothetical protein RF11_00387 [Thelohanellus kitauei]|uniref:Uncharacterized protein n=1 Tax=Thelohanellus kitauei TaxID=669202 RepID=A0A0C2IEK9_THEKT|nr:hypothetical protein RF11_00387 [Thelohanellus kitauei]